MTDMTTRLAGVEFANPVFTASGCAAAGKELDQFFDITLLGGVVTKSIMNAPRTVFMFTASRSISRSIGPS